MSQQTHQTQSFCVENSCTEPRPSFLEKDRSKDLDLMRNPLETAHQLPTRGRLLYIPTLLRIKQFCLSADLHQSLSVTSGSGFSRKSPS